MVINNPYIEKVVQDADILHLTEDIYSHKGKWEKYFNNSKPLILEIGTGMGNFFGKQVMSSPEKNFIGMEIRYKRLFQTVEKSRKSSPLQPLSFSKGQVKEGTKWLSWSWSQAEDSGVDSRNFVMLKDFAQNIDKIFIPEEISETYIFFPDPWANKKRQRKNRLLQEEFLKNLHTITKKWGKLFFKTDHREYFDSTREIINEQWLWKTLHWTHDYENSDIFDMENITEFEWFYRWEKTQINYIELEK